MLLLSSVPQLSAYAPPPRSTPSRPNPSESPFHVTIVSDGAFSAKIPVNPGESILSAAERAGSGQTAVLLPLASDCRRGSCLTCAARVSESSSPSADFAEVGPASSFLSPKARAAGFLLLCSTTPLSEGLVVETDTAGSVQDEIWKEHFGEEGMEGGAIGAAAAAETITGYWEENGEEWKTRNEAKFP